MTTDSPEVNAAVERERRFGSIESDLRDITTRFMTFCEAVEEHQQKEDKRADEMTAIIRNSVDAQQRTSANVADIAREVLSIKADIVERTGVIEELEGGLEGLRETVATKANKSDLAALESKVVGIAGENHDHQMVTTIRVQTIAWQWKALVALIALLAAGTGIAASIITIIHNV